MNDLSDKELLLQYVRHQSEQAFAQLVSRYVDLVFSAAIRMVHKREAAEDVTQKAFIALAREARNLTERTVLSGWLHKTATNLAAESIRSEIRRRKREKEAIMMRDGENPDAESIWAEVAKYLDDALARLGNDERDALFLRYFEGKSAREIAQRLGASEEAIQKRINRAVHRLRSQLTIRGITTSAATLGFCLTSRAIEAAPASLALTISQAATIAPISAHAFWPSTLKTILMTSLQKKIAIATVAALCVGGGATLAMRRSSPRPAEREAAAAAVELPLDQYTGHFEMAGHALTLTKKGKGIAISSTQNGGAPFIIYPSSASEFVSHDQGSLTTVSFTRNDSGRAVSFRLVRDGRLLGDLKRSD